MGHKTYIRLITITAFILTITSQMAAAQPVQPTNTGFTQQSAQVPLIEPNAVRNLLAHKSNKINVIDVRRPDEFAQGHIDGAILMPLDNLPATYNSLPKNGKLIVYCRSGHRSALATQFLLKHGYRNVVSMNGGYMAWRNDTP